MFGPLIFGALFGSLFTVLYHKWRLHTFHTMAEQIISAAENQARTLREKAVLELKEKEIHRKSHEQYLDQKEEKIDKEKRAIEGQKQELARLQQQLRAQEERCIAERRRYQEQAAAEAEKLQQIAQYTQKEARALIESRLQQQVEKECESLFLKKIAAVEEQVEQKAQTLLLSALQRQTNKTLWKATTISLFIPDEFKAKIIGKDGRNIRAFENITGITLLIDEQPNSVTLSSFDPVRRVIAKEALNTLISDGKISPQRIEEVVEEAEKKVDQLLTQCAGEAAAKAKVYSLHPDILELLGKLSVHTSIGQNVLEHSVEVSTLMAVLAKELKLDPEKARRIGLLHDIGKALPPETGLSHAIAGYHMALKCGEHEEIANGIGSHHDEMAARTPEGALCKIADTLSAARPGVRQESVEKHFERLSTLEAIAASFEGVDAAYALAAGKEVRVLVRPEEVDDAQATHLARCIAQKIAEHASTRVQITVIREKRVVEWVH